MGQGEGPVHGSTDLASNRRRATNTKKLHFSVTQFMYITYCKQTTYEAYDTW